MGSSETGLAATWTEESAPIPGPLKVHDSLLSEIQVIYYSHGVNVIKLSMTDESVMEPTPSS